MQALNAAVIRRRAGTLLWQQKRSISWFAQVELICAASAVSAQGSHVHDKADCFTACVQGKESSVQSEGFAVITESLKRSKGHLGQPARGSLSICVTASLLEQQHPSCQPYVQVLGALEI